MYISDTKKHWFYPLMLGAVLCAQSTPDFAVAAEPRDEGAGIGTAAQHGLYRLVLPESPERHLSLVLSGGYGFTESIEPVNGTHNRMQGGFSIGASPLSWLGFSVGIEGYRDSHPADEQGEDTTAVGMPNLLVRGGHRIGDFVQLGAAVNLTVPGGNAPSMQFSASTVDLSLLFAVSPKKKPWSVLVSAGYRVDNSDNLAPPQASLRLGDRLSLSFSEFDAVLLGLGAGVSIKKADLFAEIAADLLVGSGAPTSASPIHLTVGGRFHATHGLDIFLIADPLVSPRPAVGPNDPYAPTPARFSIIAGLAYTFGFDKPEEPTKETVDETPLVEEPVSTPLKTAMTRLTGVVEDEEGHAVGGASVTLVVGDGSFKTETDATGAYVLEAVPVGRGTLTVETYGFTPLTNEITLSESPTESPTQVLIRPPLETATQLKGLIRSIEGTPLDAKIAITPGNIVLKTDGDGYFLKDLSAGTYTVKITAQGYRTQKKRVQIENESVTILNVDMTPTK